MHTDISSKHHYAFLSFSAKLGYANLVTLQILIEYLKLQYGRRLTTYLNVKLEYATYLSVKLQSESWTSVPSFIT